MHCTWLVYFFIIKLHTNDIKLFWIIDNFKKKTIEIYLIARNTKEKIIERDDN